MIVFNSHKDALARGFARFRVGNLLACIIKSILRAVNKPFRASLRWPNTVFARAFADVIQRAHKDSKNKHFVIILFIQNPHYLRYFFLLLNAVY